MSTQNEIKNQNEKIISLFHFALYQTGHLSRLSRSSVDDDVISNTLPPNVAFATKSNITVTHPHDPGTNRMYFVWLQIDDCFFLFSPENGIEVSC